MVAALPYRAGGVDDVLRGKPVSLRDFRVAGIGPAVFRAFECQLGTGGGVNRAAYSASRGELVVRRVYDGIDFLLRYVTADDFDFPFFIYRWPLS